MSKNVIANRYEVFQHIGQGGMADVFLAVDTILNRQVAIKILRSELCTDAVSILRFEREAQAATTLSHPNIVEIYDVGEYKGHHYIVMEYVNGKTLKKVIKDRGALLTEEAVDIAKQLASATGEAHRRGIIHRDIKPQNVIVKSDGSIKILDFGIALAKGSMQLTQANNVMGSVHYLAPELAKGEPASVQSDIYALGIVLYEMVTGDVPFKAETAVQVALMQMRNTMPSPRSINPTLPQSIENIILKCTAKDPNMRYRNCNELYEDLRTSLRPERQNEAPIVLSPRHVSNEAGIDELPEHVLSNTDEKKVPTTTVRREESRVVRPAVQKKPKKNRALLTILIVLLGVLLLSGIYFALNSLGILKPISRNVEIPDLVGMTVADAKVVCDENDLVLDTSNMTYTLTENTEKGLIISVSPDVGEEIEKGSRVQVTVSSGVYEIADNFIGSRYGDIQKLISDAKDVPGQKYRKIILSSSEEANETAEPGTIIRQEGLEPGARFNPDINNEMKLVYASYPTITIPYEIQGLPLEEAERILEGLGAEVLTSNLDTTNLSETEIANLQTGIVIKCDPDVGSEYTQREDNYVLLYYY